MNKIKVLIVEDEVIIAMDLKNTLTKLEFIVTDTVNDGSNVLNSIDKNEPDIIMMDIDLGKGENGIDIVKAIYQIKYIPVIYLTCSTDDEIIERAIKTKPVAYLLKPYNKSELKATILLGIYKNENENNIIINENYKNLGFNYYFDDMNQKLYYGNNIIKLGKKEISLLSLLVQANGEIVSFEAIKNKVWENYDVSQDSIRKMIYKLRNKMDYKFIKSIPYIGFKL